MPRDDLLRRLDPFPFPSVSERDSLGLYFEVYHLGFGSDDRVHFTVEYEVSRRQPGGLLRLFRDWQAQTSTRVQYSGTARTAREVILLELDKPLETGELEVTVRVTDQTTGQTVERTLVFTTMSTPVGSS